MRKITDDVTTNILKEQFVPDNVFIYVASGKIKVFDGLHSYIFKKGDACLARKNRLAKYKILDSSEAFFPIIFCFDEVFLQEFQQKKQPRISESSISDSFIEVPASELINSFITSIQPYYKGVMQLDTDFEHLKYEELLLILLKIQPSLSSVLFDYRKPGKIDIEKFMHKNYTFNVSISYFAHLTGRSLSAFKRDFKEVFNETPGKWLTQRRLEEAHFYIENKKLKPSDFYLDLGFESLSHFSISFKKKYGYTPSTLYQKL